MFELVGVDAALDGRGPAVVDGPPKKSRPSRESDAFVGFEVVEDFGAGGCAPGVSVVLGRAGGEGTSPNKSICCAGFGGGGTGWLDVEAVRWDDARSNLAFSWTTFRGTSSSPSVANVAGSGMGPSITHLLDSYLVLIKFSIFASDGTWPGDNFDSQYLFALEFPQRSILCSCSSVQASRSTDLTRLMCVPMPR